MLRTHKDGQMKITKARSHPRSRPEINLPSCPASIDDLERPSDHICKVIECVDKDCFLAGGYLNDFLNF